MSVAPTLREARERCTFIALMHAFAHPGQAQFLPVTANLAAFEAIGEALLDRAVTYYVPEIDGMLSRRLAETGARARSARRADYLFIRDVSEESLPSISGARVGTAIAPEEGATIIVGARLGEGPRLRLRGPGIPQSREVRIGGLPSRFWSMRAERTAYPLGWDLVIVDAARVLGLARTTTIEVIPWAT